MDYFRLGEEERGGHKEKETLKDEKQKGRHPEWVVKRLSVSSALFHKAGQPLRKVQVMKNRVHFMHVWMLLPQN